MEVVAAGAAAAGRRAGGTAGVPEAERARPASAQSATHADAPRPNGAQLPAARAAALVPPAPHPPEGLTDGLLFRGEIGECGAEAAVVRVVLDRAHVEEVQQRPRERPRARRDGAEGGAQQRHDEALADPRGEEEAVPDTVGAAIVGDVVPIGRRRGDRARVVEELPAEVGWRAVDCSGSAAVGRRRRRRRAAPLSLQDARHGERDVTRRVEIDGGALRDGEEGLPPDGGALDARGSFEKMPDSRKCVHTRMRPRSSAQTSSTICSLRSLKRSYGDLI